MPKQKKSTPAAAPMAAPAKPEPSPSPRPAGITIHTEDETRFFELGADEAEGMLELAQLSELAPRWSGPPTKEEIEAARQRSSQHEESVEAFGWQLKRLADLRPHNLSLVFALVELIEFGDAGLGGGSWVLEFITSLLNDVIHDGPAKVNEASPAEALSRLAEDLRVYWGWIDDGRRMRERHPSLYAAVAREGNSTRPGLTGARPE